MSWSSVSRENRTQKRCITNGGKVDRVDTMKSLVHHAKRCAFSLKSHAYSSMKNLFGGIEMSKVCIFNDHSACSMKSGLD